MKNIYIISFLFLTIISCNSQGYEYEDRIYDCVIENNKDIENTIEKLEDVFIKHEILGSSSGKSYVECIHQIFKFKSITIPISEKLKKDLEPYENLPEILICNDTSIMLDTIAARNSSLSLMTDAFDEVFQKGNLSEPIEFTVFKNLTKDDFNHKLYKSIFLLFSTKYILNPLFLNETGIQRKLPPIEKFEEIKVKERNIMTVLVNQENEIFIDSKKIKLEKINKIVKTFYLNLNNEDKLPEKKDVDLPQIGTTKVSKGLISLQTDRHTGYKEYLQVQNELLRAIKELRDDFGVKHFKASFEDLNEEEQDIVSKVFPLSISEAEPR